MNADDPKNGPTGRDPQPGPAAELREFLRHAASPQLIAFPEQDRLRRFFLAKDGTDDLATTAHITRAGVRTKFPVILRKTPDGAIRLHAPNGWPGIRPLALITGSFRFPTIPRCSQTFETAIAPGPAQPDHPPSQRTAALSLAAASGAKSSLRITWEERQQIQIELRGKFATKHVWVILEMSWIDPDGTARERREAVELMRIARQRRIGTVDWSRPSVTADGRVVLSTRPVERDDLDTFAHIGEAGLSPSTKLLARREFQARALRGDGADYVVSSPPEGLSSGTTTIAMTAAPTLSARKSSPPRTEAERALRAYREASRKLGKPDGDRFREAWAVLAPRLFRYCCSLTNSDIAWAEDLVQDTALGVCTKLHTTKHDLSLVQWCKTIARNRFKRELEKRSEKRVVDREGPDGVTRETFYVPRMSYQSEFVETASSDAPDEERADVMKRADELLNLPLRDPTLEQIRLLKAQGRTDQEVLTDLGDQVMESAERHAGQPLKDPHHQLRLGKGRMAWSTLVHETLSAYGHWLSEAERKDILALHNDRDFQLGKTFTADADAGRRTRELRCWLWGAAACRQLQVQKRLQADEVEWVGRSWLSRGGTSGHPATPKQLATVGPVLHARILLLRPQRRDTNGLGKIEMEWMERTVVQRQPFTSVLAALRRLKAFRQDEGTVGGEAANSTDHAVVRRVLDKIYPIWHDAETIVQREYRTWPWEGVLSREARAVG